MDNINEIKLTPLQKAKKKYYEKIKNTEKYKNMISSPDYKTKIRESCSKYCNKIKDNEQSTREIKDDNKTNSILSCDFYNSLIRVNKNFVYEEHALLKNKHYKIDFNF
jgi:hypothetical protein